MTQKSRVKPRARRRRAQPRTTSCLVRINLDAKRKLDALRQEAETATELVSRAIELLRRERYFAALDQSYARMTPEEWQAEIAERALWDSTLADHEG